MTYYANYTLLRLKHCLRPHIECTSRNEFERRFSPLLASFRAAIAWVSTNIKNSGVLARIQDGRKQGSATKIKGELRAILRLRWTTLKTNWCKSMRIYNTALKLAMFIHVMLRKNMLNFRELPEYFGILAAAWSYRALQKNSTSISQEKFTGFYREFKGKWTISQFHFFFYS